MKIISHTSSNSAIHFFLKNKSLSLFLFSALLILIIAPLLQRGCFIDGMLYKTVAYNYSQGLSSFWNMKYTNTSMRFFCEQPPLYFYLLGLFYKAFGTSYLVDRVFTLVVLIGFLLVLYAICQLLFQRNRSYFLLSLFFLLTIQVICWTFVNQVIETLVLLEVAIGIWLFLKYLKQAKIYYLLLFAPLLLALFLSKGFQSCFIVVLPISYLIFSKWNRSLFYFSGFSTFSFLAVILAILFLYPPSVNWYQCYYEARILLTLDGVGATTDNHFEIVGRFFTETIGILLVLVFLFYLLRVRKSYPLIFVLKNFLSNKFALSLLITAMAGSLPYALSLVQRGFYLVPAFLCFILAMVIGFKRYWMFLFSGVDRVLAKKPIQVIVLIIAVSSFIYSGWNMNNYKREKELGYDINLMKVYLSKNDTILIQSSLWNYFNLHSYLYMEKQVSLSTEAKAAKFLITYKNEEVVDKSLNAVKVNLNSKELDLYVLHSKTSN